jgi:DNA polymerase IV
MTVRDARLLYPGVIVKTPDPEKYRYVHRMFCKIFRDYSPDVTPKSIDEAVIDLTHTLCLFKGTVVDIGKEIKRRFRSCFVKEACRSDVESAIAFWREAPPSPNH